MFFTTSTTSRVMTGGSSTQFCLKNDICQLNEPGVLREEVDPGVIKQRIPQHLAYACMYWAHHLRNSHMRIRDEDEVHRFLTRYFVHWLEAMSWLGKSKEIVNTVLMLQDLLGNPESDGKEVAAFVRDARRFIFKNSHAISIAPFQVHSSAIVFSPDSSFVKQSFLSEIPEWLLATPETENDWDPILRNWVFRNKSPTSLAFSPDAGRRPYSTPLMGTKPSALHRQGQP
ncbi:hypothetical protein LZ31DRAFT_597547 [Colletotrichum somersetense]|nr:hypothetical protein LZ31DRAFT_597547 [Colletotrichum somersetense]